jgi:hypothetical protein
MPRATEIGLIVAVQPPAFQRHKNFGHNISGHNRRSILLNSFKIGLSVLAVATVSPALAQTAAPSSPAPAAAPAPAAGSYTDDELKKFAAAAIEINKIQSDAAVSDADKQPKMLAAVQASGLDPNRFNEIATAAQSDPGLQQKISAAAAPATPGAAAPAAPGN